MLRVSGSKSCAAASGVSGTPPEASSPPAADAVFRLVHRPLTQVPATPAYNCQRPAASGQRPAASGQRPAASGQRPAASGQRPAAGRRAQASFLDRLPVQA